MRSWLVLTLFILLFWKTIWVSSDKIVQDCVKHDSPCYKQVYQGKQFIIRKCIPKDFGDYDYFCKELEPEQKPYCAVVDAFNGKDVTGCKRKEDVYNLTKTDYDVIIRLVDFQFRCCTKRPGQTVIPKRCGTCPSVLIDRLCDGGFRHPKCDLTLNLTNPINREEHFWIPPPGTNYGRFPQYERPLLTFKVKVRNPSHVIKLRFQAIEKDDDGNNDELVDDFVYLPIIYHCLENGVASIKSKWFYDRFKKFQCSRSYYRISEKTKKEQLVTERWRKRAHRTWIYLRITWTMKISHYQSWNIQ